MGLWCVGLASGLDTYVCGPRWEEIAGRTIPERLESKKRQSPDWDNKEDRMRRVVSFMEMRHYLSLARQHGEVDLGKRITDYNRFHIRLTNMLRA